MTAAPRARVCHLLFQTTLSGAPRAALEIASRLNRNRFETHLVCGGEGELAAAARARGLETHVAPHLKLDRIYPGADTRALIALTRRFRNAGYDIVHTHSSKAGFVGRLAARLAGTLARVHTVQGFAFHEFSSGPRDRLYRTLERLAGRLTEGLVFVNDEDMETARRHRIGRPDTYCRLTNGIDLSEWPPLDDERRRELRRHCLGDGEERLRLLLFVGRLAPQKGPGDLLEAAARVVRRHPEARFLLVGDGPLDAELRSRAESLELGETVRFAGWRQDVPDLLRAADVFCLPSYWEGLPLALLEAMAARVPVVASDIKGNRELVRDSETGILFPPGDADALARGVGRLLEEPELAGDLAQAAHDNLRRSYSLDDVVAGVESLYQRLLR